MACYEVSAKLPFVIFIRFRKTDKSALSLSVLKVGQELSRANIKFSSIEKYS